MKYRAILAIGVLLILVGLAQPQTETINSQACTEGGYIGDQYVDGRCVQGQAEVPNTGREVLIGLGVMVSLAGGVLSLKKITDPADSESDTYVKGESASSTALRASATVRNRETGEKTEASLQLNISDVDKAKQQFKEYCRNNDLSILSSIQVEVVDNTEIVDSNKEKSNTESQEDITNRDVYDEDFLSRNIEFITMMSIMLVIIPLIFAFLRLIWDVILKSNDIIIPALLSLGISYVLWRREIKESIDWH